MDPLELGTLYQSLQRAVARYGPQAAYTVPPMPGRAYYPEGKEFTRQQTWAEVETRKATTPQQATGRDTAWPSCSTSGRSSCSIISP
jgi:hypothetical protein